MGEVSKKQFFLKNRRYLLIGLLVLLLGVFAVSAVLYVRHLKEPVIPAVQAIPAEVAWYAEFKNAGALWEKVSQGNDMVTESINFPWFHEMYHQISWLDSLVSADADIKSLSEGQSVFVCCRYTRSGDPEYLFLMNTPDAHQEQEICDFIRESQGITLAVTEAETGEDLFFTGQTPLGASFTFSVPQGIFMISRSDDFVRSAYRQLKSQSGLVTDQRFKQVMATTGKNVDANLFFNLDYMSRALGPLLAEPEGEFSLFLESLGNWAGLDMIIRKDELLLSGYINAEKDDYLELFRNTRPQKISLTRRLPFNTAFMLYFGTDDLNALSEKSAVYHRQLLNAAEDRREVLLQQYGIDAGEDIFSWMGKEAALIITEAPSGNFSESAYGVFTIKNPQKATEKLEGLSVVSEEIADGTEGAQTLTIRKMKVPGLFQALFGNAFSYLTENYYVILDDMVVFGNSPHALKVFVSSVLSGKTLSTNENYISFSDNVSGNASLCLYVNIRKLSELLKSLVNPELRETLDPLTHHLKNFQAFAIQIAPDRDLFYTNIYLRHNPSYKDENPAVWETRLDTSVACAPLIATDIKDSSVHIVVYDQLQQVYIIDGMGRIVRKVPVAGPIISPLYVLQSKMKRRTMLLFNTQDQIWLLDLDGNPVKGFPLRPKFPVTNPVFPVDYGNTGDFRLIFVCDDHKVYNYNLDGRPTAGWLIPAVNADINLPAASAKLFAKDYIILTDGNGHCHFFNRQGKGAFTPSMTEFVASPQPAFFTYNDGRNSKIITTDHKGRIIRIAPDGDWESINLKEFPESHAFLYDDFNGDEINDYIFADTATVTVYNNSKKIIFELDLPSGILSSISKISTPAGKPLFGVVSRSSDHLYLFNEQGMSSMNNVLNGSWPFSAARLDESGYYSLITASGKTVYNYYLYDLSIIPF